MHRAMDKRNIGEPVQILKLNSYTKKYELNENKLKEIFLDEKIKEVNLAVVSIAGAFRKGKSFLLSFLMRYVRAFYCEDNDTDHTNWLGNEHDRLSGFDWRGGSKRHTTGIWIWSKIFTKTMPDGQQIGIVLMDTQGTFDSESDMHSNVTIFALSTMISSIQIYNLFTNIQEDDLQHLQLFTEYGRCAKENAEGDYKPFQQLMFLVRDWNFPTEYPYGLLNGCKKLQELLEVKPNQSTEIQSVREHLQTSFDEITCYLMPSPGEKVRTIKNFDGRLSDLALEFVDHLKQLIPYLLKPENVMINGLKKNYGTSVKPPEFYNLIKQYWEVFKSGKLPVAKNILTATTEAACLTVKSDITQWYCQSMTNFTEATDTNIPQLINIHKNLSTEVFKKYDNGVVMGDKDTRNKHRQELDKFLQENLNYYLGMYQSKKDDTLNDTIKNLKKEIDDLRARDSLFEIFLQKQLEEFMKKSQDQQLVHIEAMSKEYIEAMRNTNVPTPSPQKKSWCPIM